LSHLGEGAIELAAESAAPLFDPGDRVDPCLTCARLVEQFAADGLTRQVIAPGIPPLPMRPAN
nr:hypothetical protein [Deltaproteobacteria bacterium]